ncbi:MAG: hypothetical protein QOC84_2250 [Bradyrhizobium sp.]|nr:hypothetical protein [Bradyrhizobium sp.]
MTLEAGPLASKNGQRPHTDHFQLPCLNRAMADIGTTLRQPPLLPARPASTGQISLEPGSPLAHY